MRNQMHGQVCIVTGANSGVGYEAAKTLARLGARVLLVCRSRPRGESAVDAIRESVPEAELRLEVADLASLSEVGQLAERLRSAFPAIHLLVNNAGLYRAQLERTQDGFERTFAVNHIVHFLLTQLLLSRLLAEGGRVINVTSGGHRRGELDPGSLEQKMRGEGEYDGIAAYCESKLANVLFTKELARRYSPQELAACALHPGVLATRIWNRNRNLFSLFMLLVKPFMGRPSVGGDAVAFLAQAPAEEIHGRYFAKQEEEEAAPLATDADLARKLWEVSTELTESWIHR